MTKDKPSSTRGKLLIAGGLFIIIAVGAGIGIYFGFFHHEDAEITESSAESFFPTEKKFVVVPNVQEGVNASVQLLEQQSTTDADSVLYFVNVTFTGDDDVDTTTTRYLRRGLQQQDNNAALKLYVSESELTESIEYQELKNQVADGTAETFNLTSGAVGSYQFQTTYDDAVGIAFINSEQEQVQAFANFADVPNVPGPIIFASSMPSSSQYPTSGTINFVRRYKTDVNTGEAVPFTTLKFVDIDPPSAPGAMIYLSPMAGGRRINEDGVIPIEIEQADKNGWYTVSGTFEQEAPAEYNDSTANYYQEIIIWCEPFGVYLGGGAIEYTE